MEEQGLSFGQAIEEMRKGHRMTRRGWNGPNQWIALQLPDANSKMTLPYLYISTVTQQLVPWLASQTDMLAIDWEDACLGHSVGGTD